MSWFRVDDKAAFHRKVLRAGNEAFGALCRAGAVSSGEGTDGRLTEETCEAIAPKRVWEKLISAGLAERIDGSTDIQIHDYLQWNPSAADVEEAREAKRQAGAKGGRSKALNRSSLVAPATAQASSGLAPARAPALGNSSIIPSHPIPSQPEREDREGKLTPSPPGGPAPDAPAVAVANPQGRRGEEGQGDQEATVPAATPAPTPPKSQEGPSPAEQSPVATKAKTTRGTRCPSSIDPSAAEWCRERGIPEPTGEVAKMLDHFASQGGAKGLKADWSATWRNWERRSSEYQRGPGPRGDGPRRNTAQTNLQPFVPDEDQPYAF